MRRRARLMYWVVVGDGGLGLNSANTLCLGLGLTSAKPEFHCSFRRLRCTAVQGYNTYYLS
jgi:hypothetical protein